MSLTRPLILLALVGGVAVTAPRYLEQAALTAGPEDNASVEQVKVEEAKPQPGHRIKADPNGHFQSRFRLNGKAVDAMVDTGATFVAFNEDTARRLGLSANSLDFQYQVQTANGTAQAARVVLNSVEIGSVSVRNVEALVLRDTSLSGVLIGMSFMKKLNSFKVEDGQMLLVN